MANRLILTATPSRLSGATAGRGLFLVLLLVAAGTLALLVGDVSIPPSETIGILLYKLGLYPAHASWSAGDETIIWSIRLPRVLAAATVGACLGVAGALFQGVLRNPLADPYVIGTSAGAQLGVILALSIPASVALAGFGTVQLLAFAGALGTVLFVYALARSAGRAPVVTLLLAGFVVSSFLISATTVLVQMNGRIEQVTMWIMGSLQVGSVSQLAASAPIAAVAIAAAYALGAQLDVLALGEEQAAHLGVRVERLKLAAIVLASLLTALAVALAGIVAFVGLVVPHSARLIYGPRHRLLIVTSALCGSVFLILADLVARAALPPDEIPLGAVTAVVGAPFFLYLLLRARRDYAL